MCLTMRKADLLKLLTAVIIMFIISLPEFFKTHEASTGIISCKDACSLNNVTFLLCAFNNSSESFLQQGSKKQTIFLKVFENHSYFQNTSICQVSRSEVQPCILNLACESEDRMNVHQETRSEVRRTLEMKAKYFIFFHKYFNCTVTCVNEENEKYNTYYILEVHIRNSTSRRGNSTEENTNHSCITGMMEDQNGCINISQQLQTYVENPMRMPKIIWIVLVPFVFVLTVIIVIYKVVQENKKHTDSKYRVTAASVIQQEDYKNSREFPLANSIWSLSGTNQYPSAITYLTGRLPTIPEH